MVGVVGLVYLLRGVVKVCAEVVNEWVWVCNSRLWRLFFSSHGVLIMFRSVGGLGRAWVCLDVSFIARSMPFLGALITNIRSAMKLREGNVILVNSA